MSFSGKVKHETLLLFNAKFLTVILQIASLSHASLVIPSQEWTILLYLVSRQSSKVAETNAERTCCRRSEHCYDDQTNQDPKDAKNTTQNEFGGLVSVAENQKTTEKLT